MLNTSELIEPANVVDLNDANHSALNQRVLGKLLFNLYIKVYFALQMNPLNEFYLKKLYVINRNVILTKKELQLKLVNQIQK